MRKNWTVSLVNKERTWHLPMASFRKRKNAVDFAIDLLDSIDISEEYVNGDVEAVVTWTR